MNKEISDALYFLLHCALKDDEFETQKEQFEIIYKYIENLEKETQKYKEVIDKAIEYIKNASYFDGSGMCANDLLAILGDKE